MMERVVVIGTSCSGKTTFARRLAEVMDSPWTELDRLHWLPDWEPHPLDEFRRLVGEKISQDCWVIDGNYGGKVRGIVWARATHIVWLNYPFSIMLSRALRRTMRRLWTKEILFSGNRESWQTQFYKRDSILFWVITTYGRRRREVPEILKEPAYAHLTVFDFRQPAEAEEFLNFMKSNIRVRPN